MKEANEIIKKSGLSIISELDFDTAATIAVTQAKK
jgi:hypothetical protein